MLLHRKGSKKNLVSNLDLLNYFPRHKIFIDLFFGAGGLFFNKPKAKYNICNDIDLDVINLFNVVKTRFNEFRKAWELVPLHTELFNQWKVNKETDPIWKAVRFLYLSSFSIYGSRNTFRVGLNNTRQIIMNELKKVNEFIQDVQFTNFDFRDALNKIAIRNETEKNDMFIFADPPYNNSKSILDYGSDWNKTDTIDLFKVLTNYGVKFCISNFNDPFINDLANDYKLKIIELGERWNLKTFKKEILIINYEIENSLFN